MNPRSTPSATMTTSTGSPRRSRFGMEFSPVPMEVAAVTTFFFVRSSSRGMSSRYAAVKAPEVMTRMSSIVFMVVIYFEECDFKNWDVGTLGAFELQKRLADCHRPTDSRQHWRQWRAAKALRPPHAGQR